jgi:hypothetical protein
MMHRNPFPLWSSIDENAQAMANPTSNNIEGIQKINYDRYPPPRFLTKMNTSSAPTAIRSNSYRDNIPQPIDQLELASLSQSTLLPSHHLRLHGHLLESTVRQAARPWTKHSQWVLRLAQPKRIHTPPITSSWPLNRERPNNSLT